MSKRTCDFTEPNGFENCVYNYFCQCYNQCIGLDNNFQSKQEICTEIIIDSDVDDSSYYDRLINNALNYFVDEKLLYKSGIKYYIVLPDNTRLKLTWENIKILDTENDRKMFWLLRKMIVDSILKKLLKQNNLSRNDIQVYSVGSAKLTSDYDITLYGNTVYKVKIIKSFQKIFKKYFGEDSSIVFDTNIYGKAYITFDNREYSGYITDATCGQKFYYLNENPSQDSQLMWGLIKYLRDLRDSFGEHIYNDLVTFMQTKLPSFKVLNYASKTLIYLRNKDPNQVNYTSLFKKEQSFIDSYGSDTLLGIHDFISVINFYGTETYFTRGAFMDTVVNAQMCSNKIEIPLTEVDYLTSILENAGFFFLHHNKTKYVVRVLNTVKVLMKYYPKYTLIQSKLDKLQSLLDKLETKTIKNSKVEIDYDGKYCHDWANPEEDEVDILKCHKYELFNIIMNLVFGLLKMYHIQHPFMSRLTFYQKYVIKSSDEFGDTDLLPSPEKPSILPGLRQTMSLTTLNNL
jgi:hypothetical protein